MSAELLKIDQSAPEPQLIRYVAECIRAGKVLGMPTDTFYGLAADPVNLHAIEKIYEIKTRSRHKPLSLLIEDEAQADDLARDIPPVFRRLARQFWPGPLTMIVKASSLLPLRVTANTGNVALRVPSAKIPIAVVRELGFPITATSANLQGSDECSTAECVHDQIGERIPLIVNGGHTASSLPTTIVDLSGTPESWTILREGAIPAEYIGKLLWA